MNLLDNYKAELLYRPAAPVTEDDLAMHRATTIPAMLEMMRTIGAAGLTAPSVGIDLAFFVTKYDKFPVVVNPRYFAGSDITWISKPESSVLRPGWSTYVRRPDLILTNFSDQNGLLIEIDLALMDARVFAHLTDSLNGKQLWPSPR